jgi:hypothetical protein
MKQGFVSRSKNLDETLQYFFIACTEFPNLQIIALPKSKVRDAGSAASRPRPGR